MSVFLGTGKHVNGTSLIWDQFPSDTSCLYFIQIQTSVKKMSLLCCSGGIIVRTRASISETTLYAILHHSEQAATLPSAPQLEFPPLFRAEIWNKSFKSLWFPLVFHTVIVGSERELSSPTGETMWPFVRHPNRRGWWEVTAVLSCHSTTASTTTPRWILWSPHDDSDTFHEYVSEQPGFLWSDVTPQKQSATHWSLLFDSSTLHHWSCLYIYWNIHY